MSYHVLDENDFVTYYVDGKPVQVGSIRLKEIFRAELEGRLKILPEPRGGTCGACFHFERIPGTSYGRCKIKQSVRGRHGRTNPTFTPGQSRKACVNYSARREDDHED